MKNVLKIHNAVEAPIDDLITFRALPTNSIGMVVLNPFIFLNHHGPQVYPPNNRGLPFGPHPHRGMETVTFILEGDIMHKDTGGHVSVIGTGGIQYMRAGRGLIHAEVSSSEFKLKGGKMEILQLWLNLPAKDKMKEPFYSGFQREEIPVVESNGAKIEVIAGEWEGVKGVVESPSGASLFTLYMKGNCRVECNIPADNVLFFYVVRGECMVNEMAARQLQLVEFDREGGLFKVEAAGDTMIIFGYAPFLSEAVMANGPFVMNTRQEIMEAYADYQNGKFGEWKG